MPAHVMRGRIAKTTPAHTAVGRVGELPGEHHDPGGRGADRQSSWGTATRIRSAETPRTSRASAGSTAPWTASMWPSNRHSSGNVRLAEADIVAPSSNHSDGRLAQAALTTVANRAIAHGSSSLPRGPAARARRRRLRRAARGSARGWAWT